MHVDKIEDHVISAILHVGHEYDDESEPWPLVIESFDGTTQANGARAREQLKPRTTARRSLDRSIDRFSARGGRSRGAAAAPCHSETPSIRALRVRCLCARWQG